MWYSVYSSLLLSPSVPFPLTRKVWKIKISLWNEVQPSTCSRKVSTTRTPQPQEPPVGHSWPSASLGGCAWRTLVIYLLACVSLLLDIEFNCPYKIEPSPAPDWDLLLYKWLSSEWMSWKIDQTLFAEHCEMLGKKVQDKPLDYHSSTQ